MRIEDEILEYLPRPAFFAVEDRILRANQAAENLMFLPGMTVTDLMKTGRKEYAALKEGKLYLTMGPGRRTYDVAAMPVEEGMLFVVEDHCPTELRALALAAMELRLPLADLLALSDQVFSRMKLENARDEERVARINRALYRIHRLVDNMSDAARYANADGFRRELREAGAVFQEIFDAAIALGIRVQFTNLPNKVYCLMDTEIMQKAVNNLLSNGVKFSPEDSVLEAQLTQKKGQLSLTIQDAGEGIHPEVMRELYSRYLREPGLEDPRYGLGLGMELARSAASCHGGTLLIETMKKGTRVTLSFPIRVEEEGGKDLVLRSPRYRVDYAGGKNHALLELADVLDFSNYTRDLIN